MITAQQAREEVRQRKDSEVENSIEKAISNRWYMCSVEKTDVTDSMRHKLIQNGYKLEEANNFIKIYW